jgi:hypothetical protein
MIQVWMVWKGMCMEIDISCAMKIWQEDLYIIKINYCLW